MATSAGQSVIRHLRRATRNNDGNERDVDLLEAFVSRRDEAAFSMLVRRHGPLVLGVCRRVIGRHADAEDAFQATFMVLARKAASLVRRDLLANWLYGVAYRTALEARTRMLRRHAAEKHLDDFPQPVCDAREDRSELIALLDRELNRLSDKYRVPVVLCELEGRSRKETARLLGIPEGTLSSRLAAARRMLASRLAHRGVAVSAAAVLSQLDASASVPARLVESTVRAATEHAGTSLSAPVAALAYGVLKSMFITRLKLAAVLVAAVGITIGGLSYGVVGSTIAASPQDEKKAGGDKPETAKPPPLAVRSKTDQELLQGAWKVTDARSDGPGPGNVKEMYFYFVKEKAYIGTGDSIEVELGAVIDSKRTPRQISLTMPEEGGTMAGIYLLDRDNLKMAFPNKPGDERPKDFEGKNRNVVFTLRHDPDAKIPDPKKVGDKIKTAAARMQSANNIKQILLAIHNYHDANGMLPAAAIVDKNGKPLLSWRINLLPYLEQEALYRAFKLDEPWDSEHNKKLLARMPKVFGAKGTKTHYRVFVGEGTAFELKKGLKFADFTDGTSNTLMIVESADAVEWTKPGEFEYGEKKPLPKLGGTPFENGFHIGMADGSVRFVPKTVAEKTVRAAITRNGGEKTDE